jgi:protein-S-isoprenylcysteine O-methyltransferase Ste14
VAISEWVALLSWFGFFYPFLFHAPHWQKRESVTASGATAAGVLLEAASVLIAVFCRMSEPARGWRLAAGVVCGASSAALAFWSVKHLGRQFRIRAGLWEDHELVQTGPYAAVRHPIYAALLLVVAATNLLLTRRPWWLVSMAVFLAGTEIRVRTEDCLLESRFGARFADYRRRVRAYLPWIR